MSAGVFVGVFFAKHFAWMREALPKRRVARFGMILLTFIVMALLDALDDLLLHRSWAKTTLGVGVRVVTWIVVTSIYQETMAEATLTLRETHPR